MSIGFSITFNLDRRILSKTLRSFKKDPYLNERSLMSEIGVGITKAKAYIQWVRMIGLRDNKKRKLTKLTELLLKYDPYLNSLISQWIIHYQLAQNKDAEVWYHLTNTFLPNKISFSYKEALNSLKDYKIGINSQKHLKVDIMIYLKALTSKDGLGEINFLKILKNSIYIKTNPVGIDPLLIAFVIYDQNRKKYPKKYPYISTISIDSILADNGNAGKIFILNREKLNKILDLLKFEAILDVSHTADLDQVGFIYKESPYNILEKCYKRLRR